jgi:hypothetical protein
MDTALTVTRQVALAALVRVTLPPTTCSRADLSHDSVRVLMNIGSAAFANSLDAVRIKGCADGYGGVGGTSANKCSGRTFQTTAMYEFQLPHLFSHKPKYSSGPA